MQPEESRSSGREGPAVELTEAPGLETVPGQEEAPAWASGADEESTAEHSVGAAPEEIYELPGEANEEEPAEPTGSGSWIPDRKTGALLGVALLLLLGLVAGVNLWKTRGEVSALRAEMQALREGTRRSEFLQARAAVGRAKAELEPLRESLPPDLAAEVERAQGILSGVSDRLKASR